MKRVVRYRVSTDLVLANITIDRTEGASEWMQSKAAWSGPGSPSGLPRCSLSCSTVPGAPDRIRLDLTWRARMFVVVTVGVAAFLIALAVIV